MFRVSDLSWRFKPGSEWQWVCHYVSVMVKALILGLLAATMCGLAMAAPAPQIAQNGRPEASPSPSNRPFEDSVARSERSTNLSHINGTPRKIQMFIKNRHLQLLPDGNVNGTLDDSSVYSEFRYQWSSMEWMCWSSCMHKFLHSFFLFIPDEY